MMLFWVVGCHNTLHFYERLLLQISNGKLCLPYPYQKDIADFVRSNPALVTIKRKKRRKGAFSVI